MPSERDHVIYCPSANARTQLQKGSKRPLRFNTAKEVVVFAQTGARPRPIHDARRSFGEIIPSHRPHKGDAFTLIEMLVATVLAAVLMAAVLAAIAGVARDRQTIKLVRQPTAAGLGELLAWDLRLARTSARGAGDDTPLVLVGNAGIDPVTRDANGRLVRITYRTAGASLWRQQEYLDDLARPRPWQDCVAADVRVVDVQPTPPETPAAVPDRLRLAVSTATAVDTREVMR